MGERPKLNKTHQLVVRMSLPEYNNIVRAAKLSQRTVSDYTRLAMTEIASETLASMKPLPWDDEGANRRKKLIDKLLDV